MIEKINEYLPNPIYSIRSLSLLQELGIINLSGYDIWISDMSRSVYKIMNKSIGMNNDRYITIYTRTNSEADKRIFNHYGIELPPDKGFKVTRYSINIQHLLSKGHIYIEDIGMCLAFTREDAEAYNQSSSIYQAKHHKNLMEMYKSSMLMSPFKVMCNDPFYKLSELWTIINDHAYAIDITHIKDEPEQCKIYLGIRPGEYEVTEIDFNKLIQGEYVFKCGNTQVMLFPNREMAIKQVFKSKNNLAVFTMEELNNKIKECKNNYILDIEKYKRLNMESKNKCEIVQSENIILRQQVDSYMNKLKDMEENFYKEQLNRQMLEKEKLKIEKERLTVNAANYNNTSSILKSISTILPIAISIFGLLFMKKQIS